MLPLFHLAHKGYDRRRVSCPIGLVFSKVAMHSQISGMNFVSTMFLLAIEHD